MLYYRRKILLALLESFGGELGKVKLQKLLFLLCKPQTTPSFDFLPYHYGCFSFQSTWDLGTLAHKYNIISETDSSWILNQKGEYINQISAADKVRMNVLVKKYKEATADDLMRLTYTMYPYYAIKSKKAKALLTSDEFDKVVLSIPIQDEVALYTIGYEGVSLEKYFNKLIINDVRVLCDVRRNPLSQKVGFSKSTLKKVCDAFGIIYVHIPELGIESDKRQNLKTQKDYDLLFADYEKNQLVNQTDFVNDVFDLLVKNERIALTCFEASPCQCHR